MPYIFVHGLGQTPKSWNEVVSALGVGKSCICPDLPALVRGRAITYPNLYRSFCELCDGFPPPLHLCGLSLGGVLALQYAVDHPERTGSLVLIGTQYKMPKKLLAVQNAIFRLMPRAMFDGTGFGKQAFIRLSRTMMELDLSSGLEHVTCPVLVVCGERDQANRKASVQLAEKLPNAALEVVPNAGHEVNTQAPAALAERLKPFFFA